MTVETANYIHQLDVANPRSDDLISEGDDHIRIIKTALRNTFPSITGATNISNTKLDQINDAVSISAGTVTFNTSVVMASGKTVNSGGNKITNLGAPTVATDAATKGYVDGFAVPLGRTINNKPLSANIILDKADVGLSNVPNVSFTNEAYGSQAALRDSNGRCNFTDVLITSDRRLKTDITVINDALAKVNNLSGYTYLKNGQPEAGVIAQELQEALPEAVREGADGYLTVSTAGVVALLLEAIKELTEEVYFLKHGG